MDKLRHLLTTLLACKLNFFSCPYRKSYSPTKDKVKVNVSIHVQGVRNIKELDMEFDVRVRIKFKWFDPRLTFKNLKLINKKNVVNFYEMSKIWMPFLTFKNSLDGVMTKIDQQAFLVVKRMGKPR